MVEKKYISVKTIERMKVEAVENNVAAAEDVEVKKKLTEMINFGATSIAEIKRVYLEVNKTAVMEVT